MRNLTCQVLDRAHGSLSFNVAEATHGITDFEYKKFMSSLNQQGIFNHYKVQKNLPEKCIKYYHLWDNVQLRDQKIQVDILDFLEQLRLFTKEQTQAQKTDKTDYFAFSRLSGHPVESPPKGFSHYASYRILFLL